MPPPLRNRPVSEVGGYCTLGENLCPNAATQLARIYVLPPPRRTPLPRASGVNSATSLARAAPLARGAPTTVGSSSRPLQPHLSSRGCADVDLNSPRLRAKFHSCPLRAGLRSNQGSGNRRHTTQVSGHPRGGSEDLYAAVVCSAARLRSNCGRFAGLGRRRSRPISRPAAPGRLRECAMRKRREVPGEPHSMSGG